MPIISATVMIQEGGATELALPGFKIGAVVFEGSSKPVVGRGTPVVGIEPPVEESEPPVGTGGMTPDSDPMPPEVVGAWVPGFVEVSNVEEERESEGRLRVPVDDVPDSSSDD